MCRRFRFLAAMMLLAALVLAGCGTKDAQDVVRELSKRSEELESYMSHGKMTILTGKEPQEYDVEVWYKKPDHYRVALKNRKKDVVQILLRNQDGVYVLSPHLKKSFRFQSDWPKSSGQVYLYQSLLASILDDQQRVFEAKGKEYKFEVSAKYPFRQNGVKQRILLDEDLNPKRVEVLNETGQVLVTMEFDRFQPDASFDADAFEMQRNLNSVTPESRETLAGAKNQRNEAVAAVAPGYIPEGSRLVDEQTVKSLDGEVVIMRFAGKTPFTLTQRHPRASAQGIPALGHPVDLGGTVGVLLELGDRKRLSWIHDGIEFELLGELGTEDMMAIAASTIDQPSK
ncbi:outer membrane lipoprotein-sorting protein [Staphylospora marina]|uniref:outer membrane lipoprotein-sorting protein n=1 Tax=Staphylospora marina TaxID=2490858 RepID=UPI000F5BF29F|nr:outer membrane lipoprotein-sorting protein [Staphylospora marina]